MTIMLKAGLFRNKY